MTELHVPVDRTSRIFLEELRRAYAEEPPAPDPEAHDDFHLHEVAMKHWEWERRVSAIRLLLGHRLIERALEVEP